LGKIGKLVGGRVSFGLIGWFKILPKAGFIQQGFHFLFGWLNFIKKGNCLQGFGGGGLG